MEVRPASNEWYDGEGDTIAVHFNGWEMIVPEEVANDPVELAKVTATLKMISEMGVCEGESE